MEIIKKRKPIEPGDSMGSGGAVVDQDYWDGIYDEIVVTDQEPNPDLTKFFEDLLPLGNGKTCLEVGCYPGRFLAFMGRRGFEVHGIDTTRHLPVLATHLEARFSVGRFHQADFTTLESEDRYDVVCSFGFIEHFTQWPDLLARHARLVKPAGILIVTVPNLAGAVQRAIRLLLDRPSLGRHVLSAMDDRDWRRILEDMGFEVLRRGPFGRFRFWIANQSPAARTMASAVRLVTRPLRFLKPRRSYAPFIGIIARAPGPASSASPGGKQA